MIQRAKAAWIAFLIITVITGVKFILYWISGSFAILSEACHSIADIATTALVLFSILRQDRKNGKPENTSHMNYLPESCGADTEARPRLNLLQRLYRGIRAVNTELKISVLIGIVLNVSAITILWQAFTTASTSLAMPLPTGLIFIALSFGSYFLYRFEEKVGLEEESAALIADSQHNRADMAISLLTGISLILYYFKFDIDRWVGVFIALYVFTFATELLVNSTEAIRKGKTQLIFTYRFTAIIWKMLQLGTYKKIFYILDSHLRFSAKFKKILQTIPQLLRVFLFWLVRGTALAVLLAYLATALFTVKPDEQAIVLRLGKIVKTTDPIGPGLHVKLPFPFDQVLTYRTEEIKSLMVGNALGEETAMIWAKEHGDITEFISGDNNLFLPYIVIHFKIADIHDYYLNFADGAVDRMLSSVTLQLLNHQFSRSSFYDLALTERDAWTKSIRQRLQDSVDNLQLGISIVDFCLRDLHPPIELAGAFEEVVASSQLKEAELYETERKVNAFLSRQRREVRQLITEAQSEVTEKKRTAEGEATNYLLRYEGYEIGGQTMRDILILDSAAAALKDKTILLVDPQTGLDTKLLYIEKYLSGNRSR